MTAGVKLVQSSIVRPRASIELHLIRLANSTCDESSLEADEAVAKLPDLAGSGDIPSGYNFTVGKKTVCADLLPDCPLSLALLVPMDKRGLTRREKVWHPFGGFLVFQCLLKPNEVEISAMSDNSSHQIRKWLPSLQVCR